VISGIVGKAALRWTRKYHSTKGKFVAEINWRTQQLIIPEYLSLWNFKSLQWPAGWACCKKTAGTPQVFHVGRAGLLAQQSLQRSTKNSHHIKGLVKLGVDCGKIVDLQSQLRSFDLMNRPAAVGNSGLRLL
jgi:hypothetical protein